MALDQLRGFTQQNVYERLALADNDFDAWLEELGLFHSQRTCGVCGSRATIKHIPGSKYGNWRCTRKDCRKEIGYLKCTFFAGTHLTTKQVFQLSWFWCQRYGTYDQIERETRISRASICDWLMFFRDVCAEFFGRNPIRIGGPGIGNNSNLYNSYFPEYMWRKHFGAWDEVFYNFWLQVSEYYPCE